MPYRRVVTGVSTFIFILHKFNQILVKYEGRILQRCFAVFDAPQMQLITDLFNLIHDVDAFVHDSDLDD